MSRDFEDDQQRPPRSDDEAGSGGATPEAAADDSRRSFLVGLGKWSGALIGIALLGASASSTEPDESWRCWRCRSRCRCRCRCIE